MGTDCAGVWNLGALAWDAWADCSSLFSREF